MRCPPVPRLASVLAAALALAACDSGSKPADTGGGPRLSITSPRMDQVIGVPDGKDAASSDPAKAFPVEVMFDLRNYAMTGKVDAGGNGQHVHLIVDNEPYQALYDVSKAVPLDAKLMTPGTHVIRAFPSAGPKDEKGAAHHESRKNGGAFAWVRFNVGKLVDGKPVRVEGGALDGFDGSKPLLTYSRPKGDYKVGSPEWKRFMVDFYLSNAKLGKGDRTVRATLDGKALFEFTEWAPMFLSEKEAPAVGEHTMTLEFLDGDGKPVEGPFNKTERKFKVVN